MQHKSRRQKETLQQKVDRLNGYHVNEHDYLFDRLFTPLRNAIRASGKELVFRSGSYHIETKPAKDAPVTYGWLDAILQA